MVAGRSSQSLLFQVITDPDDGARMPPKKAMIPQAQITLIQRWIDAGLRENSGSKSMVADRDLSFKPVAGAGLKPAEPAMPGTLPEFKLPRLQRPMQVFLNKQPPASFRKASPINPPSSHIYGCSGFRAMPWRQAIQAGVLDALGLSMDDFFRLRAADKAVMSMDAVTKIKARAQSVI